MPARRQDQPFADTLLEMGWLLAALLVPLVVNLWGQQPFELPKAVVLRTLAWLLAGVWLAGCLIRRRSPWRELRANPLLWPALALAAVYLASTTVAADPALSLWGSYERAQGTLTLLSGLLLFLIVSARLRTLDQARRLLLALVATAVPVAAFGLAQALGWDPLPLVTNARSPLYTTLGRSNFTGAYLALLLPLIAALAASATHRWQQLAGGALLLAALSVIALTLARGAWLAAAVALGTFTLLWFWPALSHRLRLAAILAGFVTLVGGLALTLWLGRHGGSEAARLAIWQATLELAGRRPLLGYGPDALGLVFPRVYPPQLVYYQGRGLLVDRAHNLFLDWTVTAGLPGLLAWLALLATFFRTAWRAAQGTAAPARRLMLIACLAAVAGNAAGNLVSFDVTATAATMWLLLALSAALARRPQHRLTPAVDAQPPRPAPVVGARSPRPALARLLAAALSLAAVGCTILQLNVRPLAADVAAQVATRRSEAGNPSGAIDALQRATHLWPAEPAYHQQLSWTYLQQALVHDSLPSLGQAESELLAARDRRPADYRIWVALGELYGLWGNRWDPTRLPLAHAAYRQATALAPNHAMLYTAWGMVYLESSDPATAAATFRQAVALDATDGYAFTHLGDAELAQGHVDAALAAYRQAVHWEPALVPAYVGLASGYWRLGQREAADAALLQASHIDSNHPALQALRTEMNSQP